MGETEVNADGGPATPAANEGIDAERSRLFAIVKDSADKNRTYFFGWLLFAIYVLVTVAGTSDTQLLLPDIGVSLPILGIQLPLFSFYLAAPILVIAVHFNLLQNLDSHAFKLASWRTAWNGRPPRDELQAFLFDFALLESGGAFDSLVRVASDALFYWLGPIVLFAVLVRFSDYQDATYTTYHFIALIVSLLITLQARSQLPQRSNQPPAARHRYLPRGGSLIALLIVCFAFSTVWLTWALSRDAWHAHAFMTNVTNGGPGPSFFRELLLPRLVMPANTRLINPDAQMELKARTEGRTVDEWWREQGHGVDLAGRNLRYASFNRIDLRKADFKGAYLIGVEFTDAHLQGANFSFAWLAAARFTATQLQGADFLMADARATHFNRVNLIAANLLQTRLDGATFMDANLLATVFTYAPLEGATFVNVTSAREDGAQGMLVVRTASVSRITKDEHLEKQMPTADAAARLVRALNTSTSEPVVQNWEQSHLSEKELQQVVAGIALSWCTQGDRRLYPQMIDSALSGWPGLRQTLHTPDPALPVHRTRAALFSGLIRSSDCASYKRYICHRVKGWRYENFQSATVGACD